MNRRELKREAEFYSLTSLVKHLERLETLKVAFDPVRKGPNVTIVGATASYKPNGSLDYQSAFSRTFANGIHSCSIAWTGDNVLIGVTGGLIDPTCRTGAYTQACAIMFSASSGTIYVNSRAFKTLFPFSSGSTIIMELDCEQRHITWVIGTNRYTEPLNDNMQAPFAFCVDLHSTTATLTSLK